MFHIAGGIILAVLFFKFVLPLIGLCLFGVLRAILAPIFWFERRFPNFGSIFKRCFLIFCMFFGIWDITLIGFILLFEYLGALPAILTFKPAAICATIALIVFAILTWRRLWTMDLDFSEPPAVVSPPPPKVRREPYFAHNGARVLHGRRDGDSWTTS